MASKVLKKEYNMYMTEQSKEHNKESEINALQQKQSAWDAKRKEIDYIGDRVGRGIDEGIKETVVAFNMNGINTTGSCEGHLDHGWATPWVQFEAQDRPELRFVGEAEIFQKAAATHGIPVEDIKTMETDEAAKVFFEADDEAAQNGETEEYQTWRTKSDEAAHKIIQLLDEFYIDRDTPPETKIYALPFEEGLWRILSGDMLEHRSQDTERLLYTRREEMLAFTDFLRDKYFSS